MYTRLQKAESIENESLLQNYEIKLDFGERGQATILTGSAFHEYRREFRVQGEAKSWIYSESVQRTRSLVVDANGTVEHVCQKLRLHGSKITVIAPTRDDAERIATQVEGATVLHGDATDMQMFEEEGIGQCDVFLGLSDTDEINLMSCLLASKLQVPKTSFNTAL